VDPGTIGRLSKKPARTGSVDPAETGSHAAPGQSAIGDGDKVELTGRGRIVAQAEEMLAAIPPIDNARVTEVRTAIENGEYEINAEKIADALLRSDLEVGK
jgi:negative regulator of flagellin synthesis FlgM